MHGHVDSRCCPYWLLRTEPLRKIRLSEDMWLLSMAVRGTVTSESRWLYVTELQSWQNEKWQAQEIKLSTFKSLWWKRRSTVAWLTSCSFKVDVIENYMQNVTRYVVEL